AHGRGRGGISLGVIVITDPKTLKAAQAEVAHALHQAGLPVRLVCGMADDPKAAELLRGTWGGRLDKTLLLRTAREVAGQLVAEAAGPAPVPPRHPADPPPALDAPPRTTGSHRAEPRHGEPRQAESRHDQQWAAQPPVPLDGSRGR